ncbi:Apolipoprotein N-acyltransferase [Modestobacter italicus]|uniref:Apolipoprotein N-acyltransferase n=1 Tax=Modestobacter italicus (strain DSM 44449 / CECT 9708 / BC 501) TaxID=2732864 RepID=I4EVG1_MODI5|nr:apolipoprotein N-acyltransferase [Modestobacter marinus]CCH87374.1 Apolipoprotein N-acyltransferase [Modestobacter marinus]
MTSSLPTVGRAVVAPARTRPGGAARRLLSRPAAAVPLAVAGGLALWLAFPPFGFWPLAAVGPLVLLLACQGRSARAGAALGMVMGSAFFLPLLTWTGVFVGDLPWLALSLAQAAFYAAMGAGTAVLSRLPAAPAWSAALWVAQEALRSRVPFGGFPWGRLGFSQADGPYASFAAYGGVPLVTFAVAFTGTLLAVPVMGAVHHSRRVARRQVRRRGLLALAGVVAVPAFGGLAWLPLPGDQLSAGGELSTIAVVQGDVPRSGLDFNAQRRAVLDNHVRQTLLLADRVSRGESPQPDVVIWPENSSDIDPYQNPDASAAIDRAARAIGAPILIGAVLDGPGRYLTNAGIVWDPVTGPGERYAKRHPVPFGEYMPARSFFRLFSDQVDLLRRDFLPGTESGVLDAGGVRLGDVICFEVAYDALVSEVVDGGASVLVVQTNNATFGYTAESEQQLAMSRLRAIEHGRTVIVAATSGISAVVAPDGTVIDRSELFEPHVFVGAVAQRTQTTVATRLGALPEWGLSGLAGAALLAALLHHRRPRRAPTHPEHVTDEEGPHDS